ncbi:hypothetical protein BDP27DRAFT_1228320, partial [Rhodocollybia butyracea]
VLPCDVSTRWNSTYNMLAAFIEMKTIVTLFLDCASNGLASYTLSPEEWNAISDFVKASKVCLRVYFTETLPTDCNRYSKTQQCSSLPICLTSLLSFLLWMVPMKHLLQASLMTMSYVLHSVTHF